VVAAHACVREFAPLVGKLADASRRGAGWLVSG